MSFYKQFALTIAVSTAFSGFNALTLTPALCALFLTPRKPSKFILYRWFNKGYNKVESLYDRSITKMLGKPVISLAVYLLLAAAAFWGFVKYSRVIFPKRIWDIS